MMDDATRLLWLIEDSGIDQIGDVDIHEAACRFADARRRDEPNDDDYLNAIRYAIDRVRATDTASPSPPQA